MIQSYADKLSVIRGETSSVTHLKYLPQHLTHIDLSFGYIREVLVLPIIVTDSLKELTFRSLPPDFEWMCFENSSEPLYNNVCFKNLEYFHIHYDSGNHYKRENETEYIPAKIDIKQDVERFIDSSSGRLGYLRKDVVEYF
ncbi:hypothetical protein GGF40_001682 [Coemansia sp. RSA 1286]|nr:hypothetical protein GGF40_001682 [Coemansia sp. RSA 1286]